MVKWLCVAEKPSIAKSITQILSGEQFTTVRSLVAPLNLPNPREPDSPTRTSLSQRDATRPKWIKNYSFSYRIGPGGGHTDFTVTAVAGHLTANDFDDDFRKWRSCEPIQLFDARVKTFVNQVRTCESLSRSGPDSPLTSLFSQDPDQRGIEQNLLQQARWATHLMIWTDCDREGEFIGSMVAEVCRKANPNIVVKRARFSAIIPACVPHHLLRKSPALTHLARPQPDQPSGAQPSRPRHAAGAGCSGAYGARPARRVHLHPYTDDGAAAPHQRCRGQPRQLRSVSIRAVLSLAGTDSLVRQARVNFRHSGSSSTSMSAHKRSYPSRSGTFTSVSCAKARRHRSRGAGVDCTTRTSPRRSSRSSRTTQ